MKLRALFGLSLAAVFTLGGCSSDDAATTEPGVPPSGVFVRTDGAGKPIRLAFVSGQGARVAVNDSDKGEITERTCFAYDTSTTVKATLKKKMVVRGEIKQEQDLTGRVVERTVTMKGDGSRIEADAFLEEGKFTYERDPSTAAADVLGACP